MHALTGIRPETSNVLMHIVVCPLLPPSSTSWIDQLTVKYFRLILLQNVLGTSSQFSRRLLKWYSASRRDLPWRPDTATRRAPTAYHVLVSELMLQQTQVATVIPYFHRFIERFPDVAALAASDEQDVLRLWQGLGYYARARNLRAAARAVMDDHGGALPEQVELLLTLPGIGRYTAGAVASIAFNQSAPILDGNVMRVLCRLDRIETDPRQRVTQVRLWKRAEQILPGRRVGDFNSALMELGAMVCVPRSPNCLICPVRAHCEALAGGVADKIPAPRKAAPTPLLIRRVFCIRNRSRNGERWLIEQRPPTGRWAGMWQFITRELSTDAPPIPTTTPKKLGSLEHQLTHRRYRFDVYVCDATGHPPTPAAHERWASLPGLTEFPLPRPHLKIAAWLRRSEGRRASGFNLKA